MERKILEAVNAISCSDFNNIKQAQRQFSARELFDMWLEYEGIIGYTTTIIKVLEELGYIEGEHE